MIPYDDCVYCGGSVEERLEQIDYRIHGRLYILEDVPTGVCTQCGEKYFTAQVAKRMEAAVAGNRPGSKTLAIPVVSLRT